MSSLSLSVYHGTNADLVDVIMKDGFLESTGDDHWLGDGTYFFTEGTSGASPEGAAVKWAIAQAYDKKLKRNTYERYGVLKCTLYIDPEKHLDLTQVEGMRLFNKIRNGFLKKIEDSGFRPMEGVHFEDGHLINFARAKLKIPIETVMGNFYIKFKVERVNNIFFRLPNCTVLAALNVNTKIVNGSLKCVCKKEIT